MVLGYPYFPEIRETDGHPKTFSEVLVNLANDLFMCDLKLVCTFYSKILQVK